MPIVISVIALLINGTDYFFLGLVATGSGAVVYLIVKWIYGGLYRIDPINNPINIKTKLAFGDTIRVGLYMVITGTFAFLGQIWLRWYEIDYGQWTAADYDMFGGAIPQILTILKWGGLVLLAVGLIVMGIGRRIEIDRNKSKGL
jgi:hypothetical protein